MTNEHFDRAWKDLGGSGQRMLRDFAKHPSDQNQAYATGYVAALYNNSLIRQDNYEYLLALIGQLTTAAQTIALIKEKLE